MKIYFVSGLGADERVFKFLSLPGIDCIYIKWEKPLKQEPLASYCKRLISQIDLSEDVVLVGVSFGGIVSQEIAKLIPCKKVIIISSIKSRKEMSPQMKTAGFLKIYKLFPESFVKWSNLKTADFVFGAKTQEESKLLKDIIEDTDFAFTQWAFDEIMKWDNRLNTPGLIHIHGTEDKIFPSQYVKNAILLKEGTHFMIVNRANEIGDLIMKEIG